VKIGDVNGNAVATSQVRTAGEFGLNVADQALKAGNEYRVEVAGDLKSIEGLQFSMSYDVNAIELVDVEYGVAKEENFGIFAKEGVITASWNGDANSNTFATLVFRATADAKPERGAEPEQPLHGSGSLPSGRRLPERIRSP
jgi:hypothetical protein